jgi:hypothetical protein
MTESPRVPLQPTSDSQALDRSVNGPHELRRLLTVPLLGAVPYVESEAEARRRRRTVVASGALILAVALASIHYFLHPLPALLRMAIRYVGLG